MLVARECRSDAVPQEDRLERAGEFDDHIVTEIAPFTAFYPAEDYHQNYYRDNPGQGYCRVIIGPKMAKFRQKFAAKLKPA